MPDSSVAITPGAGANVDTYTLSNGDHRQLVIPSDHGGFEGRFVTFITPGRGATTHNLAAIHNATGSTIVVDLGFVGVDMYQTVIKAITVPPPIVRLSRFTTLPTGGTAGVKTSLDTGGPATSGAVTVWQDASADRTSSATALTITPGSGITQEFAPRLITAAGYEPGDRLEFLSGGGVTLRPLEGIVLHLLSGVVTSDPTTDMWAITMRWEEYLP